MRKLRWIAAIGFLLLLLFAFWQLRGSQTKIEPQELGRLVSEELIYADDGSVDFVAMLDRWAARDVQPGDNAYVDYCRIIGPSKMESEQWAMMCRVLGAQSLEAAQHYILFEGAEAMSAPGNRPSWEDLTLRPWRGEEFPRAEVWIKQNEGLINPIRAASQKSDYFCPMSPFVHPNERQIQMVEASPDDFVNMRELARFMAAHAMRAVSQGDLDTGLADLTTLHRMAGQLAQGSTTVQRLVAASFDRWAVIAAASAIGSATWKPTQLADYRQFLREKPLELSFAPCISIAERFMVLDAVQSVQRWGADVLQGAGKGSVDKDQEKWSSVDWPMVANVVTEKYDAIIAAMKTTDDLDRLRELQSVEDNLMPNYSGFDLFLLKFKGASARSKVIGEILASLFIPAAPTLVATEIRTKMQREMLDLGLAIAEYRLDNGKPPETLELLVPKYVDAVPLDRFSGEPLIYRVYDDGFELISVGRDGKFDDDPTPDSSKDIRFVARPYQPAAAETPPQAALTK